MEGLEALDSSDMHFICVASPGGGGPMSYPQYSKEHSLWNAFAFVQDGRVHHIGQINMFRGHIELEKVVDTMIEALTSTYR